MAYSDVRVKSRNFYDAEILYIIILFSV